MGESCVKWPHFKLGLVSYLFFGATSRGRGGHVRSRANVTTPSPGWSDLVKAINDLIIVRIFTITEPLNKFITVVYYSQVFNIL